MRATDRASARARATKRERQRVCVCVRVSLYVGASASVCLCVLMQLPLPLYVNAPSALALVVREALVPQQSGQLTWGAAGGQCVPGNLWVRLKRGRDRQPRHGSPSQRLLIPSELRICTAGLRRYIGQGQRTRRPQARLAHVRRLGHKHRRRCRCRCRCRCRSLCYRAGAVAGGGRGRCARGTVCSDKEGAVEAGDIQPDVGRKAQDHVTITGGVLWRPGPADRTCPGIHAHPFGADPVRCRVRQHLPRGTHTVRHGAR
jgi:hypothetical protein